MHREFASQHFQQLRDGILARDGEEHTLVYLSHDPANFVVVRCLLALETSLRLHERTSIIRPKVLSSRLSLERPENTNTTDRRSKGIEQRPDPNDVVARHRNAFFIFIFLLFFLA